jgi:hypothetical protein
MSPVMALDLARAAVLAPKALADVGTPMMWAGPCHLVCGNFMIGVLEGLLIGKVFKVKQLGMMVVVMVVANYVSMALGMFVFQRNTVEWFLGDVPLRRVRSFLVLAPLVTYVLSVFLEWPFVVWGMWKGRKGIWRTFGASVLANTASYVVLAVLYGMITEMSLVTVPTLVEKGLAKNPGATVYFVGLKDNGLYRMRLDGTGRERVGDWVIRPDDERLELAKGEDGKKMNLVAVTLPRRVNEQNVSRLLVPGVAGAEEVANKDRQTKFYEWGLPVDLRGEGKHDWDVETGIWPLYGLHAGNSATRENFKLALETPFSSWPSRSATILPGDQVVYEVGEQVVLLDLATKRMQFLARGRNPVAVTDAQH